MVLEEDDVCFSLTKEKHDARRHLRVKYNGRNSFVGVGHNGIDC